jgi:hypothetical protein
MEVGSIVGHPFIREEAQHLVLSMEAGSIVGHPFIRMEASPMPFIREEAHHLFLFEEVGSKLLINDTIFLV